jgi:hypothetical protein
MGLRGGIYDGGGQKIFWATCAHLLRRVRHSLASQGGITRAVRAGDLTRKFAKIEHLSAFHKVLGTHNTAEAIFSAERANYRFFFFAKITFQLSL